MKPPKRGSKKYKEILELGCGGWYDEWNGDYDCHHPYDWSCDDCPIVIEKYYIQEEYDLENMSGEKNPYKEMLEKSEDTPPEYSKIVDKHFWNLA